MSGLTAQLAAFVAGLDRVPDAAIAIARTGVVDALGTLLAARREPVVAAVRATAAAPPGPCSVLLAPGAATAADAALVNATAAHAYAMDDVAAGCHPSAVLMPVVLALAEETRAGGAALFAAYVAGFEVLAELAAREPDSLHDTGWHPTGLLGPVAAAAAAARLLGLPAAACAHALGIAASMSGGLQGNFGTQTKALHAGRAAQAGVTAARLAAAGVSAAHHALEGPKGLLATISPAGRVRLDGPIGCAPGRLRIVNDGLSIKKYPMCYTAHRVIDAALDIAGQPGFDAAAVRGIEVGIGRRQAAMAHHTRPRDALEAKYSVEFAVAGALAAGAAGFAQLDAGFVASPRVQALIGVTRRDLRDDASDDDPVFSIADRVRVWMADGRALDSGEVRHARGHARLPVGNAELERKFVDCARHGGVARPEALAKALAGIDAADDLRDFVAGLSVME